MKNQICEWSKAIFSAHLHHFLPNIPWCNHDDLYEKFVGYHKPKKQPNIQIHDNANKEKILNTAPSIFCLYHLGFHSETVLTLGKIGVNFDLLLDRDVYELNKSVFIEIQTKLKSNGLEYKFLFSDDPKVLLKIRTTIKECRHVLVFADGNSGASDNNNHLLKVQFFKGSLFVRQGITMISHILGVCILPLTLENKDGKFLFNIGNEINPRLWNNRVEYIKEGMQLLYKYLEEQIVSAPWKWECWNYIHDNGSFNPGQINLKDDSIKAPICIDNEAFVQVKFRDREVVFNRESYMLFL